MTIQLIVALVSTALLLFFLLRPSRNRAVLLVLTVVVAVSWLGVAIDWLSNRIEDSVDIALPNLKLPAFALLITGIVLAASKSLGKKGFRTIAWLVFALWLSIAMGWLAGEWSGILAITMPSLLILVVGLLALPPFVLPVAPLPWKLPTLFAMLYSFAWLIGVFSASIEMNIIGFWIYLQGMLLILRFALPMGSVGGYVPAILFGVYGFLAVIIWRGFHAFQLNEFNLLVLSQGILTLSAFVLPVKGDITDWRLGLPLKSSTLGWSLVLTGLYGFMYLSAMSIGRIPANLATFFILFLGIAAFSRFLLPNDDQLEGDLPLSIITTLAMLGLYVIVWVSGLAIQVFSLEALELTTFVIGGLTIFVPVLVEPSENWEALKAIVTFNLGRNYPFKAVVGRKMVTRDTGVPPFKQQFAGPGIILTDADHAVVIYKGGNFAHVSPPGMTLTSTFQADREPVDLRVQLRSVNVTAKTRDGIEIEVMVFTPLRLANGAEPPQLDHPYPHDAEAIRRAVHAAHFDQVDDERHGWDRVIRNAVEQIMRDIIAKYTIDGLRGLQVRQDIGAELNAQIQAYLERENLGVELVGAGIGNLLPPPNIIAQRIENWKAHWERDIISFKAQAEATERQHEENARAQAQVELLNAIVAGLDNITDLDDMQRSEVLAVSLLEAIERVAREHPSLADQASDAKQSLVLQIPTTSTGSSAGGGQQ